MNKSYILSPLLGALISTLVFWIYSLFVMNEYIDVPLNTQQYISNAISLLLTFSGLMLILSYIFFFPLLFLGKIIQKKFFLKEKEMWAVMFFVSLLIGILLGTINYINTDKLSLFFIITFTFTFSMLFNTSLYSVLNKKV